MKTLKKIQAVIVIAALSIMIGCGDQLTSTGEQDLNASDNHSSSKSGNQIGNQIDRPSFHDQVRIKPHRSYTFNLSNTGLKSFFSVEASRVYTGSNDQKYLDQCKDIEVYGNGLNEVNLGCKSSNLNLKEITIQNTGSQMIEVKVDMFGSKFVKQGQIE